MTDARTTAFAALCKIERDNSYSNLLLAEMNMDSLSPKEKTLALMLIKTVLERKITIDYNLSLYLKQPLKKLKPQVLSVLRLGACQILFADKIPDIAAVNESVKLAKKNGCAFAAGLVNAVLRKISSNGLVLPDEKDTIKYMSVKYSFSEYICKTFADYYSVENACKIMDSMLGTPDIYIRKNNLKSAQLTVDTEKCPVTDECYILKYSGSIPETDDFKEGLFHVQDLSSQLCCRILAPKAGETVIDVCASPGGKTMTMAEMMNNNGKIIACDIHEHRLKLIENTAKRLGIDIVECRLRDGTDGNESLPEADKILCDVPCSGFGVAGKKSEIKYKERSETESLPPVQLAILENSSRFLKRGGKLVYSTCTLFPDENINVCRKFSEKHPEFIPVHIDDEICGMRDGETLTILPYVYKCDGFFVAAFERKV